MALFPREEWTRVSSTFIVHGRYICKARMPDCAGRPETDLSPTLAAASSK